MSNKGWIRWLCFVAHGNRYIDVVFEEETNRFGVRANKRVLVAYMTRRFIRTCGVWLSRHIQHVIFLV